MGFALSLLFALLTQHVWEDYYITFRASKNLATGYGLVFNHGERLHTFTSPLGVLLPAACSLVTGNQSDAAALWLFRLISAGVFAGGVTMLGALTRRLGWSAAATALLVLLLVTDAKSLDYTINGMETAFMLTFLAYALWSHFTPGPRQWLHLGVAWAGLMWTRPDSFIYIGLIAGAIWLFNDPARTGSNRRQQLLLFIRAGLLTTVLYSPWLIWAGWYYGTPIPHTITAKGAIGGEASALGRLLNGFWRLPYLVWRGEAIAGDGSFLPSYFMFPAWPAWMLPYGRVLSTIATMLWLLPKLRIEVRVASFAHCFAICYLAFIPYFPFPWYLPATTQLAFVALAGAAGQLWASQRQAVRWILAGASGLVLLAAVMLTIGSVFQLRAQQKLIEDGNRRRIGEWLKANSQPGDTVFMEPLGYIGYFSGLKTYDWPGLSTREIPEAVRLVGSEWKDLILFLAPDWLVLRTDTSHDLPQMSGFLNNIVYQRVISFDRLADVQKLNIPGRGLLEFDSRFTIYRRKIPLRHDVGAHRIASPAGSSIRLISNRNMRMVHAPGYLVTPIPPEAGRLKISYGFPDDAATAETPTNGAAFQVWLVDGSTRTNLHNHWLDPSRNPQDRGLHEQTLTLPPRKHPNEAFLVLQTEDGGNNASDWTFWSEPEMGAPIGLEFGGRIIQPEIIKTDYSFDLIDYQSRKVTLTHAPASFVLPQVVGLAGISGEFGFIESAWKGDGQHHSSGAIFSIKQLREKGEETLLLERYMDPFNRPEDRLIQSFNLTLPSAVDARLRFEIRPANPKNNSFNHTFWANLRGRQFQGEIATPGKPVLSVAAVAPNGFAVMEESGSDVTLAHAPSKLTFEAPAGLRRLEGALGLLKRAYRDGGTVDGARFTIELRDAAGNSKVLLDRVLNPRDEGADQGDQPFTVALGSGEGGTLILRTAPTPGGRVDFTWCYWRNLRLIE